MDGCGFPARPQTHGHFSQASPERDSNFDQNYKPCDSTCSGVELSLLVDSSSSRLGIFLRERNATITKKAGKKAFGGTRYEKISGMVEGPFSTRDRTNTIKEDPIYQSSLEKIKLLVGSGIAYGSFH